MGRAALTSLLLTLPGVVFLGLTSAQPTEVKAKSGETAHLPCQIVSNIKVVEWSRPDLNPECVLLYQNKQFDQESQNPSFKNRVDLQDRQMKDGDASLILKNVTIKDAGTYECRVLTNRRKRAVDPIHIIYLHVDPPGQTHTEDGGKEDGPHRHLGVVAGIIVFVMTGALMTVMALRHKEKRRRIPPHPLSHDKGTELPLV
ncbi:coxsackievirus and adenovirus receptor-like [Simochromis diagramma]|uniref:coxsackievirus and adenovirus receptor-like n=1 Tax=Simochromis diagramma TaxID=43689 RepID=UPI001A7EC0F2|nr:coxsackievirus and adenovirus receptor-like [Simochromis diagramma]